MGTAGMDEQMKITVRYFALLRERAGATRRCVAWDGAAPDGRPRCASTSPRARRRSPTLLRSGSLLVAVNREYAAPETALRDGDEVAFFPPVTGG